MATSVNYPSTLPLPIESGYSITEKDNAITTTRGPFSTTLFTTDAEKSCTLQWHLSKNQYAIFYDWWLNTLRCGTLSFNLTMQRENNLVESAVYRFKSAFSQDNFSVSGDTIIITSVVNKATDAKATIPAAPTPDKLWDETSLVISSGLVTAWDEVISGNGADSYALRFGSASDLTAITVKSRDALQMTGALMESSSSTLFGDFSVVMLTRLDAYNQSGNRNDIISGTGFPNQGFRYDSTGKWQMIVNDASSHDIPGTANLNEFYIYIRDFSSNSHRLRVYDCDGVLQGSVTHATASNGLSFNLLGGSLSNTNIPLMTPPEIRYHNRLLTAQEVTQYAAYFKAKWVE